MKMIGIWYSSDMNGVHNSDICFGKQFETLVKSTCLNSPMSEANTDHYDSKIPLNSRHMGNNMPLNYSVNNLLTYSHTNLVNLKFRGDGHAK